jgi:hypothetical protein
MRIMQFRRDDPLWWLAIGVFLAVTLWMKHYLLVPYLERQYKKNAAQRQKLRTRRLRDTLTDPVLVRDLERRLMIQYQGDTSQVQDAMDRRRQQVSYYDATPPSTFTETTSRNIEGHHEEEEENDYSTRGEEKKEAATQILYGTFALAIALRFFRSFYLISPYGSPWALETIVVCVVHMMDSLQLYRRQQTSARCPCQNHNNSNNIRSRERGEGSPVQASPPTPPMEIEFGIAATEKLLRSVAMNETTHLLG